MSRPLWIPLSYCAQLCGTSYRAVRKVVDDQQLEVVEGDGPGSPLLVYGPVIIPILFHADSVRDRLLQVQLEDAELSLDEKKGLLMPTEGAAAVLEHVLEVCKTKLRSIAGNAAPQVTSMSVPEAREHLAQEIDDSLREISDTVFRLSESVELGDKEGGGGSAPASEPDGLGMG